MYAISFAAAIVLAAFWSTVSVFSQVFACSHQKPPMVVVRRKQKRVAVAVEKKTRCVTFDLSMDFKFHEETEESSRKIKAPKLLRSLTTFVGTHRRCSVDSMDSASESDCSSISSASAASWSKSPVRPAFRRSKTAPSKEKRNVRWADESELETGCELY